MKLGYGTYGMPQMAVLDAVQAVRRIGYDGVELACLPNTPASPERLVKADRPAVRQRLADLGLELPALMLGLNALADDPAPQVAALTAAIELAHDLAVGAPPVLVSTTGGSPARWEATKELVAERIGAWGAICQREGVILAVEPHVGGVIHRADQAEWVRARVACDAVKFNYDESHFVLRQIPTAESAAIMVPHAVATHLKDAAGDADHVKFLLPGEGDFDYPGFFRLLAGLGYRGYLTVEVSGMVWNAPGYDAVAAAQQCYDFLAAALAESGVGRG